MTPFEVSEAIVALTGWGVSKTPQEDYLRVSHALGDERARQVEPELRQILSELEAFKVDWTKVTLGDSGRLATAHMKALHPEISDEAAAALGWLYTWWWK